MDINAVLTFAGGLLGFGAVVLTLIVQSWKQKDAGSRMVFVHGTLIFLSLLLWASALAVKHIWNFREGAVLLLFCTSSWSPGSSRDVSSLVSARDLYR